MGRVGLYKRGRSGERDSAALHHARGLRPMESAKKANAYMQA